MGRPSGEHPGQAEGVEKLDLVDEKFEDVKTETVEKNYLADEEKGGEPTTRQFRPSFLANAIESILPWSYQPIPSHADEEGAAGPRPPQVRWASTGHSDWDPMRIFWLLLPSFVSRYYGHSDVKAPRKDETSYLNGLRGVAAIIVVLQHTQENYYPENHGCYGDDPPEVDHYIQLPYIRMILNGSFSVALFFVISGFALTYGSLKKIHAGNAEAAVASMPSSIFRRPIRLFFPILPVYLLSWILVQAQLMYSLGINVMVPKHGNFWREAWAGIRHWILLDTSPYPPAAYFPQLWTLYQEHMGSILVFLCCLAFARTSTATRMLGVSGVALWQFYTLNWPNFLFLTGMLLAELRFVEAMLPEIKPGHQKLRKLVSAVVLVVALFFGSWPFLGNVNVCYGFRHFATWIMPGITQMRFMHALSAPVTILAMEGLPTVRGFFNTTPILYLGEISYSFYLLHWAVSYTVSKAVALALYEAGSSKLTGCLAALSVTMVLGTWGSDLLWRFGDIPSVKFAKWISNRLRV